MIEEATPMSTQDDQLKAELPADETPSTSADEITPEEKEKDPVLEDGKIKINKDGKVLEILIPDYAIRGQLGSLITDELNKVFKNNEDKDMDNLSGVRIQVKSSDDSLSQESYICLTDVSSLNITKGRSLLDSLVPITENYKDVSCLIKLDKSPSGNIDLVIEALKNMDVKFFYHEDDLINYLESNTNE